MSAVFECSTCQETNAAEPMMKHLASVRHKTVKDITVDEEVACEECQNNNIHQLQIIRFGGDDMVLLCNTCFQKIYSGIEKPSTAYSLSNGTLLKYWQNYLKVRDCSCAHCSSDSNLNVDNTQYVLCDKCLESYPKKDKFVSERTGKFLFTLLKIKEPSDKKKSNGRNMGRRKGRGKDSGKGRGKGKGKPHGKPTVEDEKDTEIGILDKINAAGYANKKQNTIIESSTSLSLRSFSGFKAINSDTNLASNMRKKTGSDVRTTKSSTIINKSGKSTKTSNSATKSKPNNRERSSNKQIEITSRITTKDKRGNTKSFSLNTNDTRGNNDSRFKKDVLKPNGKPVTKTRDSKPILQKDTLNKNSEKTTSKKIPLPDIRKPSPSDTKKQSKDNKKSIKENTRSKEPKTALPNDSSKKNVKGKSSDKKIKRSESNRNGNESKSNKKTNTPEKFNIVNSDEVEEGVQIQTYINKKYEPQLSFPDLKTYLDSFSHAMFLEQKIENTFIHDFDIRWPSKQKEIAFVVTFQSKDNEELKKLIMPHLVGKTKNPFNERQPLIFASQDESMVWYTFIKEMREESKSIVLLIELFPWNKLALPTKLGSDIIKLLPVSNQSSRIFFAMTRIKNEKFIELLLGNKKMRKISFNNRLKFTKDVFNDSQKKAIEHVLNNSVTVIQGPPGTGKTSTIEELILQLMKTFNSFPILCVAASNIAIDNIAEKFIDNEMGIKVLRIVSDRKESQYDENHPLGKICLHNIVYRLLPPDIQELEGKMRRFGKSSLSAREEKNLYNTKSQITNQVTQQAQIICTTNITAGGRQLKVIKELPVVIMDESTQSSEVSTLVPLSLPGIKSFLFVGDEKQLSSFSNIPQLEMSLFERVLLNGTYGDAEMLDTQYRMHPKISEFPIKAFYNNKLKDGVTAEDKAWPGIKYPLFFYQCDKTMETRGYNRGASGDQFSRGGFSYNNSGECDAIIEVIYKLVLDKKVPLSNIGIITAYSAQRDMLSDKLSKDSLINPSGKNIVVETDEDEFLSKNSYAGRDLQSHVVNIVNELHIATVDSFQGHEKEFIIFSCVRNNKENKVGFLADRKRLNVALTRAKNGLVIVGNKDVLKKSQSIWTDYVEFLQNKGVTSDTLSDY